MRIAPKRSPRPARVDAAARPQPSGHHVAYARSSIAPYSFDPGARQRRGKNEATAGPGYGRASTPHSCHSPMPSEAVSSGLRRQTRSEQHHRSKCHEPFREAANGLTERRRSRTDRAWGYHTAQVLKPRHVVAKNGFLKLFARSRLALRHAFRHSPAPRDPAGLDRQARQLSPMPAFGGGTPCRWSRGASPMSFDDLDEFV